MRPVRICGDAGEVISAEFRGVTEVLATAAEGMMLYAVAEMRSGGPQRRFVFANWYAPGEEGTERQLEVTDDAQRVHHTARSSCAFTIAALDPYCLSRSAATPRPSRVSA